PGGVPDATMPRAGCPDADPRHEQISSRSRVACVSARINAHVPNEALAATRPAPKRRGQKVCGWRDPKRALPRFRIISMSPINLVLRSPRSGRLEGWPQARSCLWPSFETAARRARPPQDEVRGVHLYATDLSLRFFRIPVAFSPVSIAGWLLV